MTKDKNEIIRPQWAPEENNSEFNSFVSKGVQGGHDGIPGQSTINKKIFNPKRKKLVLEDYVEGIKSGNRMILARAITLIESNSQTHYKLGQELIRELYPLSGNSVRIGITGIPGAGKSTFIECFGSMLCDEGKKVAVLAVDPSSKISGGSILGDKTRMEKLSQNQNSFIRPSPSSGSLGGVTRKSRETIILCEAFGFDIILVETVGVGQSETTVRSMVDFFLLLMISGGGDELQGIKKGIIEIADALLINKADGSNIQKAKIAREEYSRALHYLSPATEGHKTDAYTCSALTGDGIKEIWKIICNFTDKMKVSDVFEKRRKYQRLEWVFAMVEQQLKANFYNNEKISSVLPHIKTSINNGSLNASEAAENLLTTFYNNF